jgi:hypothetical protein
MGKEYKALDLKKSLLYLLASHDGDEHKYNYKTIILNQPSGVVVKVLVSP